MDFVRRGTCIGGGMGFGTWTTYHGILGNLSDASAGYERIACSMLVENEATKYQFVGHPFVFDMVLVPVV